MKGYIAGIAFGLFATAMVVAFAISLEIGGALLLFLILAIISGIIGIIAYRGYKTEDCQFYVNVKKLAIIVAVVGFILSWLYMKNIYEAPTLQRSTVNRTAFGLESTTSWDAQALDSAKSYLSCLSFSESGLIEQLEYEGFTHTQAKYAAEHCGADWNEQAVKKAKSYLNTMSFSRSELISQLEYEGFTHSQAVYGADHAIK